MPFTIGKPNAFLASHADLAESTVPMFSKTSLLPLAHIANAVQKIPFILSSLHGNGHLLLLQRRGRKMLMAKCVLWRNLVGGLWHVRGGLLCTKLKSALISSL